jgi:hypothetical protein
VTDADEVATTDGSDGEVDEAGCVQGFLFST